MRSQLLLMVTTAMLLGGCAYGEQKFVDTRSPAEITADAKAKVSSSSGSAGSGAAVNDGAGLGSGSRGSGILRPDTTVGSSAASSSGGVGVAAAWKETSGACDATGSVLGFFSSTSETTDRKSVV